MATWVYRQDQEPPKKFHSIRCFTCGYKVLSKSYLRFHKGHSVHYVNAQGDIDE